MTPWAHVHACASFVCNLKAWVVVCVLFALLQRSATFFEICGCDCCDSSIEICSARQSIFSPRIQDLRPYGEQHQTQNPFVPFSRNLKRVAGRFVQTLTSVLRGGLLLGGQ